MYYYNYTAEAGRVASPLVCSTIGVSLMWASLAPRLRFPPTRRDTSPVAILMITSVILCNE